MVDEVKQINPAVAKLDIDDCGLTIRRRMTKAVPDSLGRTVRTKEFSKTIRRVRDVKHL